MVCILMFNIPSVVEASRFIDSLLSPLLYADLLPRKQRPTEFMENTNFLFIHHETVE